MLPPVIPCDNKYYKNMSALVPIKTKSEAKNAEDVLVGMTGETRQPVKFRPCPDCGCNKHPYFDRRKTYSGMSLVSSVVSAYCRTCGWETQFHDNIKKCAKEWNEAEV
jgi:hypothetical protein